MRDLNECKAEVFARSEKRIKEQKKNRNRALAFCIPLCLAIAAVSFAKLPDITVSNISDESVSSNTDAMFVQVEVQNSDDKLQSSIVNTEADVVSDIYSTIQSAFVTDDSIKIEEDPHDFADVTANNKRKDDNIYTYSTAVSAEYKIIFTTVDGEKTVYILSGKALTDRKTEMKVTLTQEQYSKIITELGLSVTQEEGK